MRKEKVNVTSVEDFLILFVFMKGSEKLLIIHCVSKNEDTKLAAVTVSDLNRFSKLFH